MAHKDKRGDVRALYVNQPWPLKEVARRVLVSESTARRWKKEALDGGDDWDAARAAVRLSRRGSEAVSQEVLEEFVVLFRSTMDALKTDTQVSTLERAEVLSRLSDAYHKTMAALAKSAPKLNRLSIVMDVLVRLADFVSKNFPQHADALGEILEPFSVEVARD